MGEIKSKIEILINRYINQTNVWDDGTFMFIKQQLGKVRNMTIEMYPNDHNPPHFHVKARDLSIDVKFTIEKCELLKGTISRKDRIRVEEFWKDNWDLLNRFWQEKVSNNL